DGAGRGIGRHQRTLCRACSRAFFTIPRAGPAGCSAFVLQTCKEALFIIVTKVQGVYTSGARSGMSATNRIRQGTPIDTVLPMTLDFVSSFPAPVRVRPVRAAAALLVLMSLAGCASMDGVARSDMDNPLAEAQPTTTLYKSIPKDKLNTAPRMLS